MLFSHANKLLLRKICNKDGCGQCCRDNVFTSSRKRLTAMDYLSYAKQVLKEHKYRVTQTRHQVLSMFGDVHSYYTIEELTQAGDKKLDTATVYRILQVLEQLSLICKLLTVNAYCAHPQDTTIHYQYCIDTATKRVHAIPLPPLEQSLTHHLPGFVCEQVSYEVLGYQEYATQVDENIYKIEGKNMTQGKKTSAATEQQAQIAGEAIEHIASEGGDTDTSHNEHDDGEQLQSIAISKAHIEMSLEQKLRDF